MTSDAAIGGDAGAPDELLQHQVPAVAAVDATVGRDVADEPHLVFSRGRDEMRGAAAVDARDGV